MKLNSMSQVVGQVMGRAEQVYPNTMSYNMPGGATVTQNRALLTSYYVSHGIVQILVDQPVDDAFRGGIKVKSSQLTLADRQSLQREMSRDRVLQTYAQAWKWARLYGGGGVILNTGLADRTPFDMKKVKKGQRIELYAADRWELAYMPQGMVNDQFAEQLSDIPYNYYGHLLHKSHVLQVKGKEAPSLLRGQFMGWGMSEVERIVSAYNSFLKNRNVAYEMIDEAKIDIFKIKGLNMAAQTEDGQAQLAEHIQAAAQLKNYQNALAVDSEDDYEQKQLSFSGLAELAAQLRIDMASDCRMPLTKLFGISPSGWSSGDSDIENYNCMVETEIRSKATEDILFLLELYCQKVFGFIPSDLEFEFKPLRETTPVDESGILTQKLNRAIAAFQNGLATPETAIELINDEGIFPRLLDPNEAMSLDELKELQGVGGIMTPGGNTDASVVLTNER